MKRKASDELDDGSHGSRRQRPETNPSDNPSGSSSYPPPALRGLNSISDDLHPALPAFRTTPPPANANHPPVNPNQPSVNANSPAANDTPPSVSANPPPVNANLPPVNANLPPFYINQPYVHANRPAVNANPPPVYRNAPRFYDVQALHPIREALSNLGAGSEQGAKQQKTHR